MQERKRTIITSGTFGSGFLRREMDDSVCLPAPTSAAAMRYWDNKFRDMPERTMDELGQLEKLNVAWATTLGNKYLDQV